MSVSFSYRTRWLERAPRRLQLAGLLVGLAGLGACHGILDVDFPGRIPSAQVNDPTLAPVLVSSVVGDFECAYNAYASGSSVLSDEYETTNGNVPLSNYGERSIGADEDDYVIGPCESNQSDFGIVTTMHTARFQSEDIFTRLNGWTDTQVPGRVSLMAKVRAYGGYAYLLMGETWCFVAFNGGAKQAASTATDSAVLKFKAAITLAAPNSDMWNLAQVGLARAYMDKKDWANAAATAALVPVGFSLNADRGNENDRRWNKFTYLASNLGAYTVADAYRVMDDPRVGVALATGGKVNFNGGPLWYVTRYTANADPIPLASYREAQLILAEAKAQQGDVSGALTILNDRRTGLGLTALSAASQADAVTAVLFERQRELAFMGGSRLNDLLRYSLPWKGANGSTVKLNPYSSRPYGNTTCWPFPTKETNGA